jgi:hypothetical protein
MAVKQGSLTKGKIEVTPQKPKRKKERGVSLSWREMMSASKNVRDELQYST